jgi:enamine deaminase RidA (YjgF/YER057c/UK114 family)
MSLWEPVVPEAERHVYDDGHIAPAVRAGGFVFCSGALGIAEDGSISEDPATQYAQLFSNLNRLLTAAGTDFTRIVDMLSFHIDLQNQIEAFSAAKDAVIEAPYPTWTAVEVAGLGAGWMPGVLAELKVVALAGDVT